MSRDSGRAKMCGGACFPTVWHSEQFLKTFQHFSFDDLWPQRSERSFEHWQQDPWSLCSVCWTRIEQEINFGGPLTSAITMQIRVSSFSIVFLTSVTTAGLALVFLFDFIANLLLLPAISCQLWGFPRWRLLRSWGSLVATHLRPHADADPRGLADPPASPGVLWPIPDQLLHNEDLTTCLFLRQMADLSWCEQSARVVPVVVTTKRSCELIILWCLRHFCELHLGSFFEALNKFCLLVARKDAYHCVLCCFRLC